MNDVGEECHCLLGADVDDGSSLDPLGELVDRNEKVSKDPGCLLERPTMSRCQTAKGHVMGIV
jgi:hypothetical protein